MDDSNSFFMDFDERLGFLRGDENLIDPPIIRVYLAGPLTNSDSAIAKECAEVRAAIKLALADYDFLGVRFQIYDPAEVTSPDSAHSAQEVYATDHHCTVCADLVVFVVNMPSLGVGIEAQLSASATTPRVVIAKKSVPVSRMFKGMFSSTLAEIHYESVGEVYHQLKLRLGNICPKTIESIIRRRPHVNCITGQGLGRLFLRQRIRKRIELPKVAELTDIQEWWLDKLERCPEFATTLSLAQLYRVMDVLSCRANLKNGQLQFVDTSDDLDSSQRLSLENLIDFVLSRPNINENRLFDVWSEHAEAQEREAEERLAARGLHEGAQVVSVEEWRKRYDRSPLF